MTDDGSGLSVLCHNGRLIYDPAVKATLFNEYFHSVFTSSDYCLPSFDSFSVPAFPCISELSLDSSEVYTTLVQLDITKAMGCDDLHPSIFKYCADILSDSITCLFNWSLEYSVFLLNGKFTKYVQYIKVGIKV